MKRISEMVRQVKPAEARGEVEELHHLADRLREASRQAGGAVVLLAGPHAGQRQLAAETVALKAGARLYRVDLSQTLDKYIGETEKNLSRIFRLAERTGAILLFDEADALFAKRTHVVDRLERHASLDTAYLLQRLEEHRSLAILTTGNEKALDDALLRIVHTVRLPAGDATAEAELIPVTWTVTPEAVEKYARLTDDFNPIHLDAAFAAATPFGQPIAQGTLTLNLIWQSLRETFGPAALPGMEIDIRFTAPVKVGETVTASGRPQPDNAAIYEVAVTTAAGTVVLSGTAVIAHVGLGASMGATAP